MAALVFFGVVVGLARYLVGAFGEHLGARSKMGPLSPGTPVSEIRRNRLQKVGLKPSLLLGYTRLSRA